ncbi:MAG TPA: trehalose-phosphatase [Vicinamibacterales bacterium]|nr:trehalose-phosphatase [Vicinamibacterales bacterium]
MHDTERPLSEEVRRRARGKHLLLLLDFDGTLVEFQADPQAVQLPDSRRAILRQLQPRATIGIVSGRRLEDVRARCALDGIIVAGLHGLEIEGLGERYVHPDLDAAAGDIAQVTAKLREAAAGLRGVFVENKGASVVLHFREADTDGQRAGVERFADVVAPFVENGRLRVMRGSYVLELLPNIDWNKGDAVAWIVDRVKARHGDAFVVYIGDDVTDQDAFAAVEASGLPIAASDRVSASTRLDGPVGVERFLAAL